MIRIKVDSRDLHFYQHFGSTDFFESSFNLDKPAFDFIQPPGDERCTAITTCECAYDDTEVHYDVDDLFNRVPHGPDGAEPRKVIGEAIKNGLKPILQPNTVQSPIRNKPFSSYWRCDTSDVYDNFDAVRSALKLSKLAIFCATPYYEEWVDQTVLPLGMNTSNYHCWEVEGWTEMNGEPMLICDMWTGQKLYMSRTAFNKAINNLGCGAYVLSTSIADINRKTIMQTLIDAMKNLVLLLQEQLSFLK